MFYLHVLILAFGKAFIVFVQGNSEGCRFILSSVQHGHNSCWNCITICNIQLPL